MDIDKDIVETRNKKQETRNKKQETRNYYDVFSSCQGFSVRETNGYCINDNGKGLLRIRKLSGKCSNYPCTVRKVKDGKFLSADEMYLESINKRLANTVVARYYKGLEGDNSNAVMVIVYE